MIVCVALAQGAGFAAPDVPDSEGHTPLMVACGAKISGRERRSEAEIAARDMAALRALLNAGADKEATLPTGDTALMTAAFNGHEEVVRHWEYISDGTISDSLVTGENISSEERQTSFHDMITLVLDTVVKISK